MTPSPWIVCQLGAREHYAVPRTLHRAGLLAELITDVWVPPGSAFDRIPGDVGERLRGRYHPNLRDARVTHFTTTAFGRKLAKIAFKPRSRWNELIDHNHWFEAAVARHLESTKTLRQHSVKPIVLAYSYAAREIFRLARDAGAQTVLAQIDGGEADEALITSLWSKRGATLPDTAPSAYWNAWREECRIADRILVNSDWSRQLLVRAGVDERKLAVVPVIYEQIGPKDFAERQYPDSFDTTRPLKALFLGSKTLRKGVMEALEAARALAHHPIQFTFVGTDIEKHGLQLPPETNAIWHDSVPRSRVTQFYRDADVFLFPSHSDGFGMTQIEAFGAGLPVIASRNCAAVVEHGKTGLLLDEVTPEALVQAISLFLDRPELLAKMSSAALAAAAEFARRSSDTFLDAVQNIQTSEHR